MHAPMSIVTGVDIVGSFTVILLSLYSLVLVRRIIRRQKNVTLYTYLYVQSIALAVFAFSRSIGHIANHVLVTSGRPDIWKALAPVSGSINSLAFVAFGVSALLYSNIRQISEQVDELIRSRRMLNESREQIMKSLKDKETLLREVHHRVKNNLAIMSSLQSLQLRGVSDERSRRVLQESRNRISAMALVHEKLYQSEDISHINVRGYLESLMGRLGESMGAARRSISLNVVSEELELGVDTLIPCGLIVNELVTNALKHAFGDNEGTVRVIFGREGEDAFVLSIEDDGAGMPDGVSIEESETLGLQLVHTLAGQLHAEVNVRSGEKGGTVFSMVFAELGQI